ncbi:MAG: hypothetical protein QF824_03855 [Candidatus Woesearchaeota archaeon]|nr:hypothetical protein [Candidatus Woesearchaeota archaeon]
MNKGRAKAKEGADIPPMPPPPADISEEHQGDLGDALPPLPDIEEHHDDIEAELPPLPDIEEHHDIDMPPVPDELKLPEENEIKFPPHHEEIAGHPFSGDIPVVPPSGPKVEEMPVMSVPQVKRDGPLFVKSDIFKNDVLDNIARIKSEVKSSNEVVSRLVDFEQDENTIYREWHAQMEDLQKKLLSVDKILFKS